MSIQCLRDLWFWWVSLPPDMAFFFSMPFMVAAAGLLAHEYRRRRARR